MSLLLTAKQHNSTLKSKKVFLLYSIKSKGMITAINYMYIIYINIQTHIVAQNMKIYTINKRDTKTKNLE